MDEQELARTDTAKPRGRWQFRLYHLLLLPVALGLALGFFIYLYPYSAMTLPVLPLALGATIGARLLRIIHSTAVECVIASVFFYVLATLLGAGCTDLREPVRRMQCTNNLKAITLALHNYHDRYGCFPPAYVADQDGRPMHSWRVLLLPFLEQQDLYDQYRFDEPWNGPNNAKLAGVHVDEYECPEQRYAGTPIMTSYVAVVGQGTAWPGPTSSRFKDFRNGTSNTLMVVEVADSGIHWMEPRDLDAATMVMSVNSPRGTGISSLHRDPGWGGQRLGANAGLVDGSVRFLPTDTPEATVRALVTAAGGEPSEPDERGQTRR